MQKDLNQLSFLMDSKFFKVLAEPARIELLKHLLTTKEADVNTLAEKLPQERSVISRHLNAMLDIGILESRKEGRTVYYRIHGKAVLEKFQDIYRSIKTCVEKGCC